jgi:uncharacterized protein with PIN domain
MRFVVDAMLGKLAKWLRILGYDTLYYPNVEDHRLIELADATGRVLLTADRELMRHRRAVKYFISSDAWREQLREVLRAYPPPDRGLFSRCLECNSLLEPVERDSVRKQVPPHVYREQLSFVRCPRCDQVYWRGTHFERVRAQLREILPNQEMR